MNMKNFDARLTDNGNLIIEFDDRFHFVKPTGEYIRMASSQESAESGLPSIKYLSEFHIPQVSKWQFLFSICDVDYSDYYWAHSSNGGKYSVTDTHNFFGRKNNGKIEFLCLNETESSGEFEQTWDGKFQRGLNRIFLIDVEDGWTLAEQCYEDSESSIQCFGNTVSWKDLFKGHYEITSNYDQEFGTYEGNSEEIFHDIDFKEYIRRFRKICEIMDTTPYEIAGRTNKRRSVHKSSRR